MRWLPSDGTDHRAVDGDPGVLRGSPGCRPELGDVPERVENWAFPGYRFWHCVAPAPGTLAYSRAAPEPRWPVSILWDHRRNEFAMLQLSNRMDLPTVSTTLLYRPRP